MLDKNQKTIRDIEATKKVSDVLAGVTTTRECIKKVFNGGSEQNADTLIKDNFKLKLIDRELSSLTTEYTLTTKKVPITGVQLSKQTVNLQVGNSEKITATVQPGNTTMDKTIVWSSEREGIATVNGGTIQAVTEGTTKVIAKAKADNSKLAECTVNVTNPPPAQ